jgi:hypothetical protein
MAEDPSHKLEIKILDEMFASGVDAEDGFMALEGALAYWLSTVCPDCRKRYLARFTRELHCLLWLAQEANNMGQERLGRCH